MNLGVLQQVGTPLDVYNHPATLFVAGFIGSPPMNFVECTLVDGRTALVKDASGAFRYPLTPAQRDKHRGARAPTGGLIFGVRAEDVQHYARRRRAGDAARRRSLCASRWATRSSTT